MSINELFSANDTHLFCDTLTCNNLVPGSIVSNKAIYRLNVDPTSNPDPFTGGLIVTAASTSGFNFAVPLTDNQNFLGLGSTIKYDPDNHLSFSGTIITCNKAGNYDISLQLNILSNLVTPNNITIAQVLHPADSIFTSPPGPTTGASFIPITSTPIGGFYNLGAIVASCGVVHLEIGDQIDIKFFLAYDSCVISLTSCLCIVEL